VVGAVILSRVLELGWFKRSPGSRALALTPQGRAGLAEVFGIEFKGEAAQAGKTFRQTPELEPTSA
jgi:hypothetical protein